jgi:hypothetical protein
MGWEAFESLKARGIQPIITDKRNALDAALALWNGSLPNLMERLH